MKDFIAPTEFFADQTSESMKKLIGLLTGHDAIPCQGVNTKDPNFDDSDCHAHGGTVDYYDCADQLGYTLAYDYQEVGYGMSRLVRFETYRCEVFDHAYDLTRDRLRDALTEMAASGRHDRDTLLAIGGRFGMLI